MQRHLLGLAIACALGAFTQSAIAADHAAAPEVAAAADQESAPASPNAQPTELEAIKVTARRRSENIEKIPVAVSAFSEEDLKDLQVENLDGLQGAVPGLNVVQGRGSSNSANIFIRGIGQPDALQTFDPGVGMYVDDVYYSRIQGALLGLFDVDHVEVLRGPQGTLYGKNSTGGAIKIVTKDPSDATTGSAELTLGNYGRAEGRFYLAGAFNDMWSASIAGAITGNDGYVKDVTTGNRYNDDDSKAFRAKLQFKPSESFKATLALDYINQSTALTLGAPTAPLFATNLSPGTPPTLLYTPPGGTWDFHARTSFGPDKGQDLEHKGVSLSMDWQISEAWKFKSISAYRWLDSDAYIDIDASQFELGDVLVDFNQKQASQELQLQYDNGSNLQAVYGLYWMREMLPSHQEAYADNLLLLGTLPIGFLRTIDDRQTTTSSAAFAHLSWEFAPTWTLAAGLRYTHETKDYWRTTSAFFGAPLQAASQDPQAVIPPTSHGWNALTPSLSLQKQFNEQLMGYVSANRGFKSGGFNGRANSAAEAANPIFNPEYVWTYELGLKMRSADNRLQANVAAFHSNYRDFQARVSAVSGDPANPVFSFPVLNAASLKMDGIEIEGAALFGEGTRLSGQLSWLNARYDKFVDPRVQMFPTLASLHDHVPFSPEFTARVALAHTFGFGSGAALTLGGDVSYRDDTWLSVDNRPGLMQPSFALVGLFGVFDSADGHWQIRAGVRNLTDKVYKTDGQEFSSVGNIQTAYFGWPRNYYISARYSF
ncbi:MAG: TonB-dependent receptor [Dokdonella sp.]|uniref:TonB-dependent receptor n=1 Tax=Dokdonella sp. TaxID=2291710 RepID=UPI0025BB1A46|nr:TonB-dependent receptor [Dokdonella sp.]MBZ0222711.1 TonB-dependent receptor [Dokdonella sp.]MCC7256660.1 TonB-dependent receptor [Dokdonella sp.]